MSVSDSEPDHEDPAPDAETLPGGASIPARPIETSSAANLDSEKTADYRQPRQDSHAEWVPVSFGDYQLLEKIACGGMGVVYKAQQKSLRRIVALKMILAGQFASPEEVQRFHLEAEAAAQLDHPSIVPIFEVGERDGQHFFSMGYVEGGSLAQQLKDGPLPPPQAAIIVRAVAEAIAYAHQQGVIHRDLKPANVLLDKDGHPKISDFGLAKQAKGLSHLTVTGQVLGTPSYMPPEQASCKTENIGPPADIYSLGAMLYCVLTGRPPFQAASPVETLRQVLEQEPVSPRRLNAAVSRDLETICLKCLQKEPGKRYATAQALADDLGHFLTGEPIKARPVGGVERAWRWCRRNPLPALLMTGIALSLVVGISVSSYFAYRAHSEAMVARANEEKARAEKALSDQSRYDAVITLTARDWQDGHIGRVMDRLEELAPRTPDAADLRGFEWYYLQRLCHLDLRTLSPGGGTVFAVAYSPDGRRLATAGMDKTVTIWDLATRSVEHVLRGHSGSVHCVCWSPDGRLLATAGDDHTVRLWDALSGNPRLALPGHTASVRWVAFHPDGQWLASCSSDKTTKIWKICTGELARTLTGHADSVWGLAYSPDGRLLATSSWDKSIQIHDGATGQVLTTLHGHFGPILRVAFSRDGQLLASASTDNTVKLWNTSTWQEVRTLASHEGRTTCLAFSPDGKRLVCGSDILLVWDVPRGREPLILRGHIGNIYDVVFSPDGRCIASAGNDHGTEKLQGAAKIWDASSSQESLVLSEHSSNVTAIALSGSEQGSTAWLATGSSDQTIKIWPVTGIHSSKTLSGHVGGVAALVIAPHDSWLASGGEDGTVRIWDRNSGQEQHIFRGDEGRVPSLSCHPDGRRLASASWSGSVKIWDVLEYKEILTLRAHNGPATCLAFSPDGALLVTCGRDRTMKLWDVATGTLLRTLRTDDNSVVQLAFSPDGKRLATAGGDLPVHIWDLRTGDELLALRGHTHSPRAVSFSPDGRRIVTAGMDGTLKLWNAITGQETLTLRGHVGAVYSVAFTSDGQRIASGGADHTVRIWEATPLTPERLDEREAASFVRFLETKPRTTDLMDTIRADNSVSVQVRAQALSLARPSNPGSPER
jgi:eukaryotic-like serine/threonine-protein kinase